MYRYTIILLFIFITTAQAEMKCEAGKCSSGKPAVTKDVPKKIQAEQKKEKSESKKKKRANKPTIEQLFNVRTVKVSKQNSTHKQVNYGYIVAEDALKTDVVAWFSGFVENLYADTLYKKVTKGEALAKVYSPEVYKAKQDYLNSINFDAKRPSPAMVRSAKIKLELLNVSTKEISHIKRTHQVEKYTTLVAPASGWIFEKNINQGSSFGGGKKLFQIVELDRVWMEVKLYQNELEKINRLKDFTVRVKGIDKTFKARRPLLYPVLNPKEATATLRLELNNAQGILRPGMYAKVYATADKASHLVIPRTAAIRKNGNWYAFLSTQFKGEYEPVKIELKPLDNSSFELLSGLKDGDSIVNNALFMMDSDAQINSIY